MPDTLKPCPKCKGTANVHVYGRYFKVRCLNPQCGFSVPAPGKFFATKQEAIDAWNRRVKENDNET